MNEIDIIDRMNDEENYVDAIDDAIHEIERLRKFENRSDLALYQSLAGRTSNPDLSYREALVYAALGMAGESGEVANHVKKFAAHGHDLDIDYLADELGDVLWYIAEAASAAGLSLVDIAARNIDKLCQRYPDGFSEQASRERGA